MERIFSNDIGTIWEPQSPRLFDITVRVGTKYVRGRIDSDDYKLWIQPEPSWLWTEEERTEFLANAKALWKAWNNTQPRK